MLATSAAGRALIALTLLAAGASVTLVAQPGMPDASQMAGIPLPAPDLPAGTVAVRVVREQMGNNVVGQTVTVTGAGQTKTGTTDAQGRAEFTGLPAGATVVATAIVDGETLTSEPLPVPERGGVRVALVAGVAAARARERAAADDAAKAPAPRGTVVFGGESRIIWEYQDDAPTVFYILDIVNGSDAPVDPGAPLDIQMPDGASNVTILEGSTRQATLRGDIVRVTGPFPPGSTSLQIGFSLPDSGRSYTLRQPWPAAFERVFVAVERAGDLQVSSPQLPATETINADGGKVFVLASGGRLAAGEELVVSLNGLPADSVTGRYVAMGLAALILGAGAFAAFRPSSGEATARLRQERERLLAEIVGIDERQTQGRPKARDAARRSALVAELERVLAALDQTPEGGQGAAA